jgi:S-formylglutathione hydrolase FrmB
MPDGGRGFYTDAIEGFAYESAIIRDLIPFIDNTFHTKANREGRCIGGLSMGGYGAIRFALRYPELFCSAHSHSGAFRYWEARAESPEFQRIFGKNPKGSENDIFALASKLAGSALPKLRIDCGVNDFLFESNQEFHAHLNQLNIPHEYEEFPGEHNWAYWDAHISQALAFHAKNLGIC